MQQRAIHYNPSDTQDLTACKRPAFRVTWRLSPVGITCKACLKAMAKKNA